MKPTPARRDMAKPRKERQREISDPPVPTPPKKGKVGTATKATIQRKKEPLRGGRKVK